MRKLVESTFVTLDGVISMPQEWGAPYWDDEHNQYAHDLLFAADALLLGRQTYEGFVGAWPSRTGEYSERINSLPKYVASRTLTDAAWNSTILEGNVAEAVAKIKAEPGGQHPEVRHRRARPSPARAQARGRVPLLGLSPRRGKR